MYRRWMPALIAVPAMAIVMSLVAGVPFRRLGEIVTGGAVQLAPVYVAVVFGALLGRVTIDTGIARAIVDLAAEYGGERPFLLALVFCAIVALLFTSLSGLGGIIMVGSIVLPIMMTAGVPRTIAATLFLMAFALGYIFNIANWTFYTKYFGVAQDQLVRYAIVLALIDAIALVAYAAIAFRRERGYATWAVRARYAAERTARPGRRAVHAPVAAPALLRAAHRGDAGVHRRGALRRLGHAPERSGAAARRGRDSRHRRRRACGAALHGHRHAAGRDARSRSSPRRCSRSSPAGGCAIRSPTSLVFGLASPLVLYRGPLNPFGVGIAIFTVLLTAHVLPPVIVVAAIMAVVQVQNVCDPTNTANVWIANFTGVPIDTITKRTLPYQAAVATAATLAVAIASPALFGVHAFASLVRPRAGRRDYRGGFLRAAGRTRTRRG